MENFIAKKPPLETVIASQRRSNLPKLSANLKQIASLACSLAMTVHKHLREQMQ
jgi:hypothetical protein